MKKILLLLGSFLLLFHPLTIKADFSQILLSANNGFNTYYDGLPTFTNANTAIINLHKEYPNGNFDVYLIVLNKAERTAEILKISRVSKNFQLISEDDTRYKFAIAPNSPLDQAYQITWSQYYK